MLEISGNILKPKKMISFWERSKKKKSLIVTCDSEMSGIYEILREGRTVFPNMERRTGHRVTHTHTSYTSITCIDNFNNVT